MLSLAQTIKQFRDNFGTLFDALGIIRRETEYKVDDSVFGYSSNEIDFGWFLNCTKAGKTGTDEISIPKDAKDGDVITDGTVEWTLEATIVDDEESGSSGKPGTPFPPSCLSFIEENKEPFTLKTSNNKKNWDGTLEYSTDAINWSEWSGAEISSSDDGKLYLRGTGNTEISSLSGEKIVLTNNRRIQCQGNIENLLDYETVKAGKHPKMGGGCYVCMFQNCTSLTSAPELPATTLIGFCYSGMFIGCTNLTAAPELPATTLANQCYSNMFSDCTNLTSAPSCLPATTLAGYCYTSMFKNCSKLTGKIHCPASTASNDYRLDANAEIPANTATVVYDL